jgi:hypothetical protein
MANPRVVDPPVYDPPIMMDHPEGQRFSRAWTDHNQAVADRLSDNTAAIAAMKTGVVDGSDAAAGQIGEYATATSGSVGLTSATPADTATLSLGAGDHEVWGAVFFSNGGATQLRQVKAWISDTPTTPPGDLMVATISALFVDGGDQSIAAPRRRISLAVTTTIYLGAQAIFGISTSSATGTICARRVR